MFEFPKVFVDDEQSQAKGGRFHLPAPQNQWQNFAKSGQIQAETANRYDVASFSMSGDGSHKGGRYGNMVPVAAAKKERDNSGRPWDSAEWAMGKNREGAMSDGEVMEKVEAGKCVEQSPLVGSAEAEV